MKKKSIPPQLLFGLIGCLLLFLVLVKYAAYRKDATAEDRATASTQVSAEQRAELKLQSNQEVTTPSSTAGEITPSNALTFPAPQPVLNVLKPETGPTSVAAEPPTKFEPITVYYGTDRVVTGNKSPWLFYSGGKSTDLSYGTCVVTIPPHHTPGVTESPHWYQGWRKFNSEQDVNLVTIDPCDSDSVFVARLGAGLQADSQREIFLFIHGFANTFADAARRTAQLAYDGRKAGYPMGIPVMYSFPSWGTLNPFYYVPDEQLLDASSRHLAQFLFTLHVNFPNVPINIVAHSMGNHLFCLALPHYEYLLAKHANPAANPSFSEVAMEAPDEDEDAFSGEAPGLFELSRRVTLYGCAHDRGIWISEEINKGDRIGDTKKRVFVLKGMDSVDATSIADWVGHEYYALNPDIPLLFMHWSVAQRKLQEAKKGGYYILLAHH